MIFDSYVEFPEGTIILIIESPFFPFPTLPGEVKVSLLRRGPCQQPLEAPPLRDGFVRRGGFCHLIQQNVNFNDHNVVPPNVMFVFETKEMIITVRSRINRSEIGVINQLS